MDEVTSVDFEWMWRNKISCISQVYKLIMAGCVHESVLHFIEPRDEFLKCGHRIRGKLIKLDKLSNEDVMRFNKANIQLEQAWNKVIPFVKLVS